MFVISVKITIISNEEIPLVTVDMNLKVLFMISFTTLFVFCGLAVGYENWGLRF